ncbi:MAG TPA: hypothetical protein VF228_04910 [Iamia sp.]
MDPDPLTPSGPPPSLDVGEMRNRVRDRAAARRRRATRRAQIGLAALVAVGLVGGAYGATRDRSGDDPVATSAGSTDSDPSSTSSSSSSTTTSTSTTSTSTSTSTSTTSTTSTSTPPGTASCPFGLDPALDGATAGLEATLVLDGTSDPPSGTARITNLGPGPVTISHAPGGLDVIGLDAAGHPVRDGNGRLRGVESVVIPEGGSADVPVFVHTKVCGPGGPPTRYIVIVTFYRADGEVGGFTIGQQEQPAG